MSHLIRRLGAHRARDWTISGTTAAAVLGGLCVLFLVTAALGIDFGKHWDEAYRMKTVANALARGQLLPGWYGYPTVIFHLLMLGALPEISKDALLPAFLDRPDHLVELKAFLLSQAFLIRARLVFATACAGAIVATYWMSRSITRSRIEACVAAAILGLSWEYAYHSRWIAPDAVMATASATTMALLCQGLRDSSAKLVRAGAALAGLACSTKYPGGILLGPVLTASALLPAERWQARARACAVGAGIFVASFLVFCPGSLLEYRAFIGDVRLEMRHYASGHPGGHAIESGFRHLIAELEYCALALTSHFRPVAAVLAAPALFGAAARGEHRSRIIAMLVVPPVLYLAYMAHQRVFIVRNLLVVLPFLSVLAARGWMLLLDAAPSAGRLAGGVLLAGLLTANASWLVRSALSIRDTASPETSFAAAMGTFQNLQLSPPVSRALHGAAPPTSGPPKLLAFYASEAKLSPNLVASDSAYTVTWFGPYEVNYNYYPAWAGRDRIVVMDAARARQLLAKP